MRNAVVIAFTVALVALLVSQFGGAAGLVQAIRGAKLAWVALSFAAGLGCLLAGTVRWMVVVDAMGRRLRFGRALDAVLATWPLSVVTPARASDLARAWAVRDLMPVAEGLGAVLAEKVVDLFVLLAFVGAGAAVEGLWIWFAVAAAGFVAEAVGLAVFARPGARARLAKLPLLRRRAEAIEQLFTAFRALRSAPGRLTTLVSMSVLIRVLTVGVTYALLIAFGADVSLLDTAMLWPLATLLGLAPVTLGGMGTRDAAFLLLVGAHGHVTESAVLAATMGYSALASWSFGIVGLPFMWREARKQRVAAQ